MKRLMFIATLCVVFASCSKKEDAEPDGGEKMVAVKISHSENFMDFEESLNFQVITSHSDDIDLKGTATQWDDIERPADLAVWFTRTGDIPAPTRSMESTKPVSSITVAGVIMPKEYQEDNPDDLTTTIEISVAGKVVKTETITSTHQELSNFSIPITVNAY